MTRLREPDGLTELEGATLGLFRALGPCTPYTVRCRIQESPSEQWSASAGAIYPLVKRLERRGLIRVDGKTPDAREGCLYAVTEAGEEALRRWIGPPCSEIAIGVPPDALRTRMAFLDALTPEEQAAFLADATERVRVETERIRRIAEQEAGGDPQRDIMNDGALRMMIARYEWLVSTSRAFDEERVDDRVPR